MNSQLIALLTELTDSNNAILDATKGTATITDEQVGNINNNACDVAFIAIKMFELINAK